VRLCEFLLTQNLILSQKQIEFRQIVLDYKHKDIEAQSSSIKTIEKILYEGDYPTGDNPEIEHPSSYISLNLKQLDERQKEQTAFLNRFSSELTSLTKQLINTNYSMFSTTSIEEGSSNLRIEESTRN
jgi:hypothetical protein